MTDQDPDIMTENGKEVVTLGYPLEYYFEKHGPSPFQMRRTSRHRGYVATWEIKDDALYLISIEGTVKDGEKDKEGGVADVFPGKSPPILADWIDGNVAIAHGKPIRREGWDLIYENEEMLKVKKGKIVGRKPLKR